jgi:hypothetical protein
MFLVGAQEVVTPFGLNVGSCDTYGSPAPLPFGAGVGSGLSLTSNLANDDPIPGRLGLSSSRVRRSWHPAAVGS